MKEIEKVVTQLPTKKPQAQMVSQNSSTLLKTVNTQSYLKLFQKHKNIRKTSNKVSITLIAKPKQFYQKQTIAHVIY